MTEIEQACHHILWVWYQYGKGRKGTDGIIRLEHQNMEAGEEAGEEACEFLEERGYVVDEGYSARVTNLGIALMAEE